MEIRSRQRTKLLLLRRQTKFSVRPIARSDLALEIVLSKSAITQRLSFISRDKRSKATFPKWPEAISSKRWSSLS